MSSHPRADRFFAAIKKRNPGRFDDVIDSFDDDFMLRIIEPILTDTVFTQSCGESLLKEYHYYVCQCGESQFSEEHD